MAMSDKRECPDYRSSDNRNRTVIRKNAVQRSQTAEFVFITATIRVMLLRLINAIYFKRRIKTCKYILWGQMNRFFNVKAAGTYIYHFYLMGQRKDLITSRSVSTASSI